MTSTDARFAVQTSYARDLLEAARDNPVPTALIGVGLIWMVMGGDKSFAFRKLQDFGTSAAKNLGAGSHKVVEGASSLATSVSGAASTGLDMAADHASEMKSSAQQPLHEGSSSAASASSGIAASISDRLDAATHTVGDVASSTRATANGMSSQASNVAVDLTTTLRNGFADLLDRQPLIVGALGLAVGAGLGAALPRVAAEESLTDALGTIKGSVRDGVVGAYTRAADEAHAQGLTLEGVSDAVSTIGDKVSGVAKGAVRDASPSSI